MSRRILCLLAGWAFVSLASAADRLQVFPFPQEIRYSHHNDDYTVRVRTPGGVWQDLFEYTVKVDQDTQQKASMVNFNFEGRVEVAVQKNNGSFREVEVRPRSRGIRPVVKGGIATFTLTRPENLSIEFDGDRLHNLHVFTHAIRRDMPQQAAGLSPYDIKARDTPDLRTPQVVFGPGVYRGEFRLQSNTTVYIDGSAVLKGPLIIDGVENVKVISDGLFDGADQSRIRNARNVVLDGLIYINQPHGALMCANATDVEERDIRIIGGGAWSDGMGHFACERVTIRDSFVRTSDDCLTFYNHRNDIWGNTRDVTVSRSVLWADVAHAIMIGIHGNTPSSAHPEPELLERLAFRDLDVLEHDEDEADYEGVIGIMAGDDNLVRDVLFEDIRVERIEEGKLFSLRVVHVPKYNTSPGRGIENVTLRNIAYSGQGMASASRIGGFDAGRRVRNIVIDNVTVGGRPLTAAQPNVLDIEPHVDGVRFVQGR
jgi:hypothetical protein